MVFAVQVIWFYALWLIVPLGAGKLFFPGKKIYAPEVYLMGVCTAFAVYEVVVLICSPILMAPLSVATAVWIVIAGILAVLGWKSTWTKSKDTPTLNEKTSLTKRELLLLVAVLLPLLLQTARAVTGLVTNSDDAFYCAQATTAVYSNKINSFAPQTGQTINPRGGYRWLNFWSILWASVSQLTGIHPAIIMRTLLPAIMIPCAYMAVYIVLKELLDNSVEKALAGVFLLEIAYEIMACNDGMKQWWLLLVSWFGKSVAPNLICPFLFYLYLRLESEPTPKGQKRLWLAMAVAVVGGCVVATSSYPMIAFEMGILGIAHLINKRDLLFSAKLVGCGIPAVLLLAAETLL